MAFSKALYFAALVPSQAVKEEVRNLKLEIRERVGAAHALKLPAHITLVPPVWLQNEKEPSLVDAIRGVTEKQLCFPVKLQGFGRFDQRVIFLNVVDPEPVKVLHHQIIEALKGILVLNEEKELHPHMTLATRDLPRERFMETWEIFKERKTHLSFEAKAITIFKHNGKTWDVLEELNFR